MKLYLLVCTCYGVFADGVLDLSRFCSFLFKWLYVEFEIR